jgi:hypothetical protein
MNEMCELTSYLLSSIGLAVLIVWPAHGPSAWLREKVARKCLGESAQVVLDCYICCSFWTALVLAPLWWYFTASPCYWFGCLMAPCVVWLVLMPQDQEDGGDARSRSGPE